MVTPEGREGSLLTNVKAVEPGYPWYGEVALASGRPFGAVLLPGTAIVEETVLGRLGLRVASDSCSGANRFDRRHRPRESDRPVTFFSLGPRVFVAAAELGRLDLIGRAAASTTASCSKSATRRYRPGRPCRFSSRGRRARRRAGRDLPLRPLPDKAFL